MIGSVKINGKDLYGVYTGYISGRLDDLPTFPALKEPMENDWAEYDGKEVDLSEPLLSSGSLQVVFAFRTQEGFHMFMTELASRQYHEVFFRDAGVTRRLRLTGKPEVENPFRPWLLKVRFADDFPLYGYEYEAPSGGCVSGDYTLDDVPFGKYGVRILSGTLANLLSPPEKKEALLLDNSGGNGAVYDGEAPVVYKEKELVLNALMTASDADVFWRNRDALLYDLVRPGSRRLYVEALFEEYPCYYKSCKTDDFYCQGRVWWRFSLSLVLQEYNPSLVRMLSDQSGNLIVTETDGRTIDLVEYGGTEG